MTDSPFYNAVLLAFLGTALLAFVGLLRIPAPYGRHRRGRTLGLTMGTRAAWVLMESPSCVAFAAFFLVRGLDHSLVAWILFGLWQAHYVQRSFVYPLRMRVRPGDAVPVLIAASGVLFHLVNSYLNATWIGGAGGGYETSWLWSPAFLVGLLLFAGGYATNRWADEVLRSLRDGREYGVPRGGLYERVSCPNYLGEIVEWAGWALMSWSLAGLAFAAFTAANLVPRALAHHRWYRATFPDYPPARRAVFPHLL